MSMKKRAQMLLIVGVLMFAMGCVFKYVLADQHKGSSMSTGVVINGNYLPLTTGTLGGNSELQKRDSMYGTVFMVLGGVMSAGGAILLKNTGKSEE